MKILRIYLFLPPCPGGMEKHILRLSHEQRKSNNNVVIAFNKGRKTSDDDVNILPFINLKNIRPQFVRDFIFYGGLILYLLKNKHKFDVIHIHGDWSSFLFGSIIKNLCKSKVLVGSVHDGLKKNKFWAYLYKKILNKYSFIYCTGSGDSNFLTENLKTNVYWRSSGIDKCFIDNNSLNLKDIDVVSVGSFVKRKNHLFILSIAEKTPHLNYALVGDGPLLNQIMSIAKQKNINNVVFFGALDYYSVSLLLKRSKILLMTSFSEGTPTSLLEAMASGCVVVTSNSNDYSTVINNGTSGFIINDFVLQDYLDIINDLIIDDDKRTRISKLNVMDSKKYLWSNVECQITSWMNNELLS